MRVFTWGVDGYGRRVICHHDTTEFPYGVACPINGYFWELMDILELQDGL